MCTVWYTRLLMRFRCCSLTYSGGMTRWVGVVTRGRASNPRSRDRKIRRCTTWPQCNCTIWSTVFIRAQARYWLLKV